MISLLKGSVMRNFFEGLGHWLRFTFMYLGNPPWDTGVSPPELIEFIQNHPPGRVIDLGCGTGTNLITLGKAGWQLTGVDFVPSAAAAARKRLARENMKGDIRTGDVTHVTTVLGNYDLVLDIGCYHGLPSEGRAAYRANLKRILRPNGMFLLYANWAPEESPPLSQKGKCNRHSGIGLREEDLIQFSEIFFVEKRQDSRDRWGRKASWITFARKGKNAKN